MLRTPSAAPSPALPLREEGLSTLNKRTRLDATYVATCIPQAPLAADDALFMRLRGQTDSLECRFGGGELRIGRLMEETIIPLKSLPLPENLRRIDVVKSPGCLEVYCNGLRLAATTLQRQNWRSMQWLATATTAKPELSYQKVGSLFFADNFMHGEGEMGEWKNSGGEWSVHALKTPVRSANPFSFMGKGENATATTGFWFWRNYRLSCAVQPLEASGFAIRINCMDDRCNELRWEHSSQRLILSGYTSEPATTPLALMPGKWYHLSLASINGCITAAIDGTPLLALHEEAPLLGGQIALVANGTAIFDDVVVDQMDDSLPQAGTAMPEVIPADIQETASQRRLTFHNLEMSDCELSATLSLTPSSQAILTLREAISGSLQLAITRKADGSQGMRLEMLTAAPQPPLAEIDNLAEATLNVVLRAVGRDVFILCNGETLAVSRLPQTWSGGASIDLAWDNAAGGQPTLQAPRLRAASPLPQISTHIATFTSERSMQNWNDPVREWLPAANGITYWHRSDFWSDIALTMNTASLERLPEFGLALGTTASPDLPATPFAQITYNRNTQVLAFSSGETQATLNIPPTACKSLGLERRGDRLLARLNGNLAWNLPLQSDGRLILAGRVGKGNSKAWAEAVEIRAEGVHIDVFDKAPINWIAAAGNWEVTNRWQCDPRWSFFSGVNPNGAACLWSKFTHGENITMEYFMGPKMDRSRGNNEDKYAADHNLVIAADGKDIASGYSVMLGGWSNRGTQLVRQKEILAENKTAIIDKSGIHHRWYHVKVRKQQNAISVWLDGKLASHVTDPAPLKGNRFALWTWKNGIMVAQLRFSTDWARLDGAFASECKITPVTPYD